MINKKINSQVDHNKLPVWAYLIIALDVFVVVILSLLGLILIFESISASVLVFAIVVSIIYLYDQVIKGNKIALLLNTIGAMIIVIWIFIFFMIVGVPFTTS